MNVTENLTYAAKYLSSLLANRETEPDELYEALDKFEQMMAANGKPEILREIREALALGKWRLDDLAALIASWGDTLDDHQVLEYLRAGSEVFRNVYSDRHS